MNVRHATTDDAPRIAAIHVEAWRAAYRGLMPDEWLQRQAVETREAFWSKHLRSGSSHTLVAEDHGQVVGWIDFGDCRDVDTHADAEVYAMYLEPTRLRCGIGSALWRRMREDVSAGGRRCIKVWVLADNVPARRFYEAMGGSVDEGKERRETFGGVELREVRYAFEGGQ